MSISDIEAGRKKYRKTSVVYLGISAFCAIFSAVYEHFSHGVYSGYMVYLALFPLIGGFLPCIVMLIASHIFRSFCFPKRVSYNLYNSGIATLTVGSVYLGVLEIYGTTSALTRIYFITGAAFVLAGITAYIINVLDFSK